MARPGCARPGLARLGSVVFCCNCGCASGLGFFFARYHPYIRKQTIFRQQPGTTQRKNQNKASARPVAKIVFCGSALPGSARPGAAQFVPSWVGSGRSGSSRRSPAPLGSSWLGLARLDSTQFGSTRLGSARHSSRPGLARVGSARLEGLFVFGGLVLLRWLWFWFRGLTFCLARPHQVADLSPSPICVLS